jgi:hypothetical protein
MRQAIGVVLLGAVGALAQPAKDGPLLKPVAPPSGMVRVRVPFTEGMTKAIQMKGQVPNPRKKGEVIDASVALDTAGRSVVTVKILEKWGYPRPANNTLVLPELLLVGNQLAPKLAGKGTDVLVRLTNLKLEVRDTAPDGGDQIFGADMIVFLPDLLKSAAKPPEPRLHFADRFLDLTVPPAAVKRPGTGEELPTEPEAKPDPTLAVVACPLNNLPSLSFATGSVNGMDTYVGPDGKPHPVVPILSSVTHGGSGVLMNIGLARALKLDVDPTKATVGGMTTNKKLQLVEHVVRELRLGVLTGPGLKTPQELVLTDLPIWVEVNDSEPALYLGYPFITAHFKDAVLAITPDGTAKLHGRVNPELLKAPLPRKKP